MHDEQKQETLREYLDRTDIRKGVQVGGRSISDCEYNYDPYEGYHRPYPFPPTSLAFEVRFFEVYDPATMERRIYQRDNWQERLDAYISTFPSWMQAIWGKLREGANR